MKEIALTQGYVALVDDEDYEALAGQKWTASVRWYAVYAQTRTTIMHRLILGHPPGDVNHINGNGLDNRRGNLRLASRRLTNANAPHRPSTSRFKGVSWDAGRGRWQVGISPHGKRVALGRFDDETEAALVYDAAARKAFGSFAALNFPKPGEQSAHRDRQGAPRA